VDLGFPTWVGVVCEDLESQRRFYEDVLGFQAVREGDGFVEYDLAPGTEFELIERSTEPEYDGARYQVGFAVDDIDATRRELIARGVTPISEIHGTPGLGRWAYFKDPEGNVFELKEAGAPA
jgi:predicted enzyme related to lactoylglutathione lyase